MYSAATPQRRNNYDHPHSDLEVVPDGTDYDKVAVPSVPPHHSHHDKILVPPQPYYQKEAVVEQQQYNSSPAAGYTNDDASAAPIQPPARPRRENILGLRRKTFFILVWIISIALAIAIGVGAGVGASRSSSRSDNDAAAAAADETPTGAREEITSAAATTTPSQTDPPQTSTPPPAVVTTPTPTGNTTSPSPSTGAPPPLKIGGVGGRCTNQWGADCVCLDAGICRDVWRGTAYSGYEGNWPCPDDPNNIMACVVKPCLGKVAPAQCLWREACREVNSVPAGSAPICPGDGEFVCCAHEWV